MKLYNAIGLGILSAVDTLIGASGCLQFYSITANIPTTALLVLTQAVMFAANAMPTYSTAGVEPGTQCTGVFAAMTTGTVATGGGTAAFFAILTATNAATPLFTGSVATTGADLNFYTVNWDAGDNVNITSLNFKAPQGS